MNPIARGISRQVYQSRTPFVSHASGLKSTSLQRLAAPRVVALPRTFSTKTLRLDKKSDSTPKDSPSGNPEYPTFSLESLGISRNVKILIYTLLGIFGTMETWFYCKWIWRWWKSRSEPEPVD